MRWITMLRLRLRSLFRRGRVEAELGEELQYHFDSLVDTHVAAGLSPAAARDAARREMGAVEPRKEECRDARGLLLVDSLRQDVRDALRTLRRAPAFAAVAVLSLALGIGVNTALSTLWNGVLHASLPGVREPGRLVMLTAPDRSGGWTGRVDGPRSWVTYGEFEQIRDRAGSFSSVMATQSSLETWQVRIGGGSWEEASGRLVSGGFFETLGVRPAIGRLFTSADDRADSPTAVISDACWHRRFGHRPDVLGQTITIQDTTLTIIGVTPPGFVGETAAQQPDVWLPLRLQPRLSDDRDRLHDTPPTKNMWLHLFARLKPGVTMAQAEAEANAIFQAELASFYGATARADGPRGRQLADQRLEIRPGGHGASPSRRELSPSLTALLAAVGVLLLIACANLAGLLLARGTARLPEIALRLSLGASRARLIRQLLTESLTLAAIAGLAAISVASLSHAALVRMLSEWDTDFQLAFTLDPALLAFVLAATIAAALAVGALPAWLLTRIDAGARLKDQSRGAIGAPGHLRSGRLLVSLQLALSLPLLVGAGLLARTAYNLQRADLGFPTDRLLLVRVDLRKAAPDTTRNDVVRDALLEEVRRVPGVRAASLSQLGLFTGGEAGATIDVDGYTPTGTDDRESSLDIVGAGYFTTLGIPIRLGRDIEDRDRDGAARVCVINEAFAKRFFAGRHPIGLHIAMRNDDDGRAPCQVVGVAGDARAQDLRARVAPRFFIPVAQYPNRASSPTLLIRTASDGDAAPLLAAVRAAIGRASGAVSIMSARSLGDRLVPLTAQDWTTARLAVAFGGVALLLAAIGLYGLLSYGIARRTGEIALRLALGASPGDVLSLILREAIALVAFGMAIGGGLAYATSRLVDSRLYGVAPRDPLTLTLAAALLLIVALAAAYLPARRASRLDPIRSLH